MEKKPHTQEGLLEVWLVLLMFKYRSNGTGKFSALEICDLRSLLDAGLHNGFSVIGNSPGFNPVFHSPHT